MRFEDFGGMTIRQVYKAAALTGVLMADIVLAMNGKAPKKEAEKEVADTCRRIADALLAEDAEHEGKE